MLANLGLVDLLIVFIYFGIVFYIARWATFKRKHAGAASVDYFLSGKSEGWFVIGAALFACYSHRSKLLRTSADARPTEISNLQSSCW